ncbi:MAG: AraC family transcriptional regulator [Sphaerochaeta sp.]|nr:AraC family transcriptional regulator [Sphaerochaeta sp.]MDX9915337.1 AraC family transcriptional regulator [Sphaerochaeta sp.]
MDTELNKASRRLSELTIAIDLCGFSIDIQWMRVMQKTGRWKIPRHAHSSFEFHFIAHGGCKVETDERSFIVGPGSLYVTGPGIYHQQSSHGENGLIEYSLDCTFHVRKENELSCQGELGQLHDFLLTSPCKPVQDANGVIPLYEQALKEALERKAGWAVAIHSLVPAILISAARNMGFTYNGQILKEKSRMELIGDFVEDNIFHPIGPADIATFMNLSEKQISRIIFASEGYPTKRYITFAKVEQAKKMLEDSSNSLGEIAALLGFATTSYFNTVFRKIEGISPGAYRAQSRSESDTHHT